MELTLNHLKKSFGQKTAVNQIQASFSPGIYGLLGANGAGKTTLMRMICNVLTPTSGEILLDGNNTDLLGKNYRKLLGYLPQNFGYYLDYRAQEFMDYIAALKGIPGIQAKRETRQLLELVSLSDVSRKKIKTFSGLSLFKEYLSYHLGSLVCNVNEMILLFYLLTVLICLPLAFKSFKRHQVQ